MAHRSSIEWTESTWNPVTGCDKVSPGCKYCYAERMAKRLQAMGQPNYAMGFEVTLQPHMLDLPLKWKKPQTIFVNSMSDLFHAAVPTEFIQRVFEVMRRAHWHRFQILTKRSSRLAELDSELIWTPNIWMGVSVENQEFCDRIEDLRSTRAHVRFLSLEPLLGPIPDLRLDGIDWVIVGGESGPRARPMHPDWARDLRQQCQVAKVPFFFKQWGQWSPSRPPGKRPESMTLLSPEHPTGPSFQSKSILHGASADSPATLYRVGKRRAGRLLDGQEWNELPCAAPARVT
jgi:protein gp37